jgi:hypothetical protein
MVERGWRRWRVRSAVASHLTLMVILANGREAFLELVRVNRQANALRP